MATRKNSWIEFLKRNGGKGYTRVQLQSEYKKNSKVALRKKPSKKRTSRKKSSRKVSRKKRTSRKKSSRKGETVKLVRRDRTTGPKGWLAMGNYEYTLVVGEGKDKEIYDPRQSIVVGQIKADQRIINLWRRLNKKGPFTKKMIIFKDGIYRL